MTAPHASQIINGYLARLSDETKDLPSRERGELIDGVREHITEARAVTPEETDADLLNLLDRLGDPADLAEEERQRLGMATPRQVKLGVLEIGALVLTPLVWPVGVILLWASDAWSIRDKLIGTLLPPGGLFTSATAFFILGLSPAQSCVVVSRNGSPVATHCSGGLPPLAGISLLVGLFLLLALPILTGIYMSIQLRRHSRRKQTAMGSMAAPA
ncbi:MAG TPA: hypothetical protein VFB58_02100 [Chloroflexota bacterium]|nr:hypothetical protein [Chloroflexota bacterium]